MDSRSCSPIRSPPTPAIQAEALSTQERFKRIRDSSLRLQGEASRIVKKLKRSTDDSQDYWQKLSMIHDLRGKIKSYAIEGERIDFLARGGNEDAFNSLDSTLKLTEAIQAHKKQKLLFEEHNQKLKSSNPARRVCMSMFTCSRIGLNVAKAGVGVRECSDQRAFKKNVLRDYDLEPGRCDKTKRGLYWSVVHGTWIVEDMFTAAHIFPVSWGQKMMTEMFGDECKDELVSSRNGLLLPKTIERAMDEWAILIVPDLPNDPDIDEVKPWISSAPREYKFRVLDHNHPELNKRISNSDDDTRLGRDLDQSRLVFRGNYRPRARFLWLWFACAILKRFWASPIHGAPEKLTSQFGRGMWATGGHYLRRDFVLGIMEEMGHEIDDFMLEGAMPSLVEEDQVPNKAVAAMLASRVVEVCEKEDWEDEDEEGGDDEEDDDDAEDDEDLSNIL
ncbi:hypothetical protein F4860DRAFT_521658 [Xylaria cubensis]|nr:hypothetical protein F4860DRAFT_521658 [Xylaria cubensis]